MRVARWPGDVQTTCEHCSPPACCEPVPRSALKRLRSSWTSTRTKRSPAFWSRASRRYGGARSRSTSFKRDCLFRLSVRSAGCCEQAHEKRDLESDHRTERGMPPSISSGGRRTALGGKGQNGQADEGPPAPTDLAASRRCGDEQRPFSGCIEECCHEHCGRVRRVERRVHMTLTRIRRMPAPLRRFAGRSPPLRRRSALPKPG